jgi:hypothetical protein
VGRGRRTGRSAGPGRIGRRSGDQPRSCSGPRMERGRVRAGAGGVVGRRGFGVDGEDPLERLVAGVADGQRPGAGRLQPVRADAGTAGQADDALRRAEPVDRVVLHQLVDDGGGGRADLLGFVAAPGRGAHVERDLLRRVVLEVGRPSLGHLDVGGHDLVLLQDLHRAAGGPGVQLLPDQPPRHGVQGRTHLQVTVHPHLANRPGREDELVTRQRLQSLRLDRVEHRPGCGAVQAAMLADVGDPVAPGHGGLLDLLQAGELPAPPERITYIGHCPLDPGLVLGLSDPRRVGQHAVMGGQLGVGPVHPRVVQVGPVHPGLQIVGDEASHATLKVLEREHMTCTPGCLVQPKHRVHKHQPRTRQHHHERPQRPPPVGGRVDPRPQSAVIDLRLAARFHRRPRR